MFSGNYSKTCLSTSLIWTWLYLKHNQRPFMYTLLWNLLIGNNCCHLASEKLASLSCHCVHSTCEDLRGTFSSKLFATGALSPLPPEIEPFHGYFWGLSTAPRVCKDSSEVDLSNSRSKLSGFHPSGRAQGGALVSALRHKGPFAWFFLQVSSSEPKSKTLSP